jgi:hypothetical protein
MRLLQPPLRQEFLTWRVEPSSPPHDRGAPRLFYGVTLSEALIPERIPYGREPRKLPVVLGADEVVQFLEAASSLKSRAALATAFALAPHLAAGRLRPEIAALAAVGERDAMRENATSRNFRVFGPDETASNRLQALFEATDRAWDADTIPEDDHLAPDGRVMEILSEHTCQGWREGYLLTGRHGLFSCYEAFIHIVDSMFNQHAKWLKASREIAWRRPIAGARPRLPMAHSSPAAVRW